MRQIDQKRNRENDGRMNPSKESHDCKRPAASGKAVCAGSVDGSRRLGHVLDNLAIAAFAGQIYRNTRTLLERER